MSKKLSEARLKAEVYDILHADDPERKAIIKKWNEQLFGSNNQKKGVKEMVKNKKKYSTKEKAAYWAGVGIAAQRFNESDGILNNSNAVIAKSARNGYSAADKKDINNIYFSKKDTRVYPQAKK